MRELDPADVLALAQAEADQAWFEYEAARSWFRSIMASYNQPLAAEVWVFDPPRQGVLLVRHRWRGWVPPGGKAEADEGPRAAAARELFEETGVRAELHPRPAAVTVRSYHPGWPASLGLAYAAIVDHRVSLSPEEDQPVEWWPLDRAWESCFPDDRDRMLAYLTMLT